MKTLAIGMTARMSVLAIAVTALLLAGSVAAETVNVPACGLNPAITQESFSGFVELTITGEVLFVPPNITHDAFYNSVGGQVVEDNGAFRFTRAEGRNTCGQGGDAVRNILLGPFPDFNPAHEYTVLADLGPIPNPVAFGIADCGCGDNAGELTVTIEGVESTNDTIDLQILKQRTQAIEEKVDAVASQLNEALAGIAANKAELETVKSNLENVSQALAAGVGLGVSVIHVESRAQKIKGRKPFVTYPVKVICGESATVSADFNTGIHVLNLLDQPIQFTKRTVIDSTIDSFEGTVGAGKAVKIDCQDIRDSLSSPTDFIEGFVFIETLQVKKTTTLEVMVVYSADR